MSCLKTIKIWKQLSQICVFLLLAGAISGCSAIRYYSQAIGGHMGLMFSGQPVAAMAANPDTPPELRRKLLLAMDARSFAETQLHLPVGDAFTEYVQLDQPWVLVNLVAVPEFSLTPHQWCYPFAGCQAYRGFFNLEAAKEEQRSYQQQGFDTFLAGVTAYSTLGWFDDPLHSGFTGLQDWQMAALMFHELAHRVLYIPGDTTFNESFATAVELEGLRLWLNSQDDPTGYQQALTQQKQLDQTRQLVNESIGQLQHLYEQTDQLGFAELRERKAQIFDRLAREYQSLTRDWPGPGPLGADPEPLNNARLALFTQYRQYVPAFRQLFRENGADFAALYKAAEQLGERPPAEREEALSALAERFDEHL